MSALFSVRGIVQGFLSLRNCATVGNRINGSTPDFGNLDDTGVRFMQNAT